MSIEERLRRLEARGAIRELRAKYCYVVDEREWEKLNDLFTDDAVLDFGAMGVYEGRQGLERFATEFVDEQLQASAHLVANPMIEVDGNEATGRWYVNAPISFASGKGAWRIGRYADEYRRVGREWRIDHMRLRFVYTAEYDDDGWTDLTHHMG